MDNNSIVLTQKMLHDIHNKLASVLGYSEILQDEDSFSQEQMQMLRSITSAALNIKSLLSVKKEESSDIDIEPKALRTKDLKILIVDDNEDNRIILELMLKKYPLKIFTAQNGLEALKVANEQKPDLIFMDLNLPDINGQEVSKIIKKELKDIKIIALTGDVYAIEREMKNSDIFELCLAKPFDRNQIKNIINKFINETAQKFQLTNKLPQDYLLELIACAKMGRISCLEDFIRRCDDKEIKKFLEEKVLSFNFDEIIVWAKRVSDENANC